MSKCTSPVFVLRQTCDSAEEETVGWWLTEQDMDRLVRFICVNLNYGVTDYGRKPDGSIFIKVEERK